MSPFSVILVSFGNSQDLSAEQVQRFLGPSSNNSGLLSFECKSHGLEGSFFKKIWSQQSSHKLKKLCTGKLWIQELWTGRSNCISKKGYELSSLESRVQKSMDWKALNSRVADWKVQLYFKNLWNELSSLKFENVLIGGFNGLQKSMGWKTQFVEKNADLSGTGFEQNLDSPVQSFLKTNLGSLIAFL